LINNIDYHEIIECIACALDAKDPSTAVHSERVSDMSLVVCRFLDLSEKETEEIHIAAHLHDIGKIGISDAVLNKKGKLNDEEWEEMKCHPEIGAGILAKSKQLRDLKDIVLCHHERYDGSGYPLGRKGEEIPYGARVIAICDSIDAMISDRTYREAHSFSYCYEEIKSNLGSMYDPEIGKIVLANWNDIIMAANKKMIS